MGSPEPRTKAGKRLLTEVWTFEDEYQFEMSLEAVLAIEAEAAQAGVKAARIAYEASPVTGEPADSDLLRARIMAEIEKVYEARKWGMGTLTDVTDAVSRALAASGDRPREFEPCDLTHQPGTTHHHPAKVIGAIRDFEERRAASPESEG